MRGKFTDEYYQKQSVKIWYEMGEYFDELGEHFDWNTNIYLGVLESNVELIDGFACGLGGFSGNGGIIQIPASGQCFENINVTVHELGHAFGLLHDYRNNSKPQIDLYSTDTMIASFCAAEWLDAHRYFNDYQTNFNKPTTIERQSLRAAHSDNIRLRFKITDLDGLHQAQLAVATEAEYAGIRDLGLLECKSLDGTENIVEFVTPQLTREDYVHLRTIDVNGNIVDRTFFDLEKITGPWLWIIAPTEIGKGGADSLNIDSLAIASGGSVTETDIAANGAKVGDAVGDYVWTLGEISASGGNNVNDLVNKIGFLDGVDPANPADDIDVDHHSSYALITLESATDQFGVPMQVGSDDAIKVWLNGEVVHDHPINRGAGDFQDKFSIDLKVGDNLLLVKVSEAFGGWSMFVGIDAELSYKRSPDVIVSEDINGDGVVNVYDLIIVAVNFGVSDATIAQGDVNEDGTVDREDILIVLAALEAQATAGAPTARATTESLQQYIDAAKRLNRTDAAFQKGIAVLEHLLVTWRESEAVPRVTALLPNYPNPFNPETWIPYQLAKPVEVSISIYSVDVKLIRTLELGYQHVGVYHNRARAAHWDGKNEIGEPVASGVYFYTLTARNVGGSSQVHIQKTTTRKMLIKK